MASPDQKPVACITGGASGIGKAVALALSRTHTVVVADIDAAEARRARIVIEAEGGHAIDWHHDVTDENSWLDIMNHLHGIDQPFRVLINNAGICIGQPMLEMTLQTWRHQMAVNLDGVFLGMKHAVPGIAAAGGGTIVNIASVAAIRGIPGLAGYCASKAGIIGVTRAAALECAAAWNGVRINAVLPGAIETPIWAKIDHGGALPSQGEEFDRAMSEHRSAAALATPLGVPGAPEDVAEMVVFLTSEGSRFITGSHFVVDGGSTAGV